MKRIITIIIAVAIFLPSVISAQQIMILPEVKIIGKVAAPAPNGIMRYSLLEKEAMRAKVIKSNAPYVSLVLITMLTLANNEASKKVLESYESFFANPTSNDPRFQSACKLLNLAYCSKLSSLESYVVNEVYAAATVATDAE